MALLSPGRDTLTDSLTRLNPLLVKLRYSDIVDGAAVREYVTGEDDEVLCLLGSD